MKVIFFGTPNFSLPFLNKLIDSDNIEVVAVVCQKDKPVGRKAVLTQPATKKLAIKHNISTYQFNSLKTDEAKNQLSKLDAELYVVVAYGKIIPQTILDIPQFGAINVHPSLLPKYRGPSPMQEAILNGDKQTGITIMLLDSGMDTGPILEQITLNLDDNDSYITLENKVHEKGPELLLNTINKYVSYKIEPKKQNDLNSSTTKLINREDGLIDWNKTAIEINRQIRAYQPWPGTYTYVNINDKSFRLKIFSSEVLAETTGTTCGEMTFGEHIKVSTKTGTLRIKEVQLEGKSKMNAETFMKGYKKLDGSILKK